MIEVIIERWTAADGSTDHLWTLWREGTRVHLGNRLDSPDEAVNDAIAFCQAELGVQPDRITRL